MSRRVSRIQATITQTRQDRAGDRDEDARGHADDAIVMPDREQQRLDAAAGEVDLLAGGRDLGLERAHEM